MIVIALELTAGIGQCFDTFQKLRREHHARSLSRWEERYRIQIAVTTVERGIPGQVFSVDVRGQARMNVVAIEGASQWRNVIKSPAPQRHQIAVVPRKQLVAAIAR